jgi:hypothetical protein
MQIPPGDRALQAFSAAAVVFIAAGNGLDAIGLGIAAWLALAPAAAVYYPILRIPVRKSE